MLRGLLLIPPGIAEPASFSARVRSLVRAIEENDEAKVEEAILRLSRSRRVFAPLAFAISAFVMLYDGLRLLVSNWRLTLVQILPAMWIWLAMFDLKAHTLHGKSFNVLRGPILIPIGLAIVTLTVASYFLNAVFAFAISQPGRVEIRPAVAQARRHWVPILVSGGITGALLAFSTTVVTRWGRPWFALSLGIIVGVMMVSYVAVPARLIGAAKRKQSRRDKLSTSVVGGALSATVCTPPYILGRLGILMLGSSLWFIPGIFVLALGSHAASRRDRSGQGDQDERDPHESRSSESPGHRAILNGREKHAMDHTSIDIYLVIDTFLLLLIGIGPKIALVPFLEVTAAMDSATKALIVRKMLVTAGVTAVILIGLGELLARLLHFSTGSLSIAGGIILLIIAVTMVLGSDDTQHKAPAEGRDPMQIAVFPLAIPYLLNPAGIVTLVTLSAESNSVAVFAMVLGLLALVLALDVAVFRWANRVSDHLDESRMLVTEKIFGFLLAALAVQLMLDGLDGLGLIHLSGH